MAKSQAARAAKTTCCIRGQNLPATDQHGPLPNPNSWCGIPIPNVRTDNAGVPLDAYECVICRKIRDEIGKATVDVSDDPNASCPEHPQARRNRVDVPLPGQLFHYRSVDALLHDLRDDGSPICKDCIHSITDALKALP